ncbi:glycosyltransferase [Amylibacter sp.]|nr:glycosyltransferase [Amylibacter sp.]
MILLPEFSNNFIIATTVGFSVTFIISAIIVMSERLHGKFTFDLQYGVQKTHIKPTPRVGGIAIITSIFIVCPIIDIQHMPVFKIICLGSLPVFCVGLLEDITKKISVKTRFLAALLSGFLFIYISGYSITDAGISFLNLALAIPIFSILFTLFCISGLINSFNLIDGFNGLSSGTAIILLLAFACISNQVGDITLTNISLLLAISIIGFFAFNFPLGKLFLGDGGAYLLGYIIAALVILLPVRNHEVSPWISLLIVIYPTTETLASILRRKFSKNKVISAPDRNHLHHLLSKNIVEPMYKFAGYSKGKNSLTALISLTMPMSTLLWAIFFEANIVNASIYITSFVISYSILYCLLLKFSSKPDFL